MCPRSSKHVSAWPLPVDFAFWFVITLITQQFPSQFELTTVHRSKDPKHLAFVSAIRESQPSRDMIKDYFDFGQESSRFLTSDRTLDE